MQRHAEETDQRQNCRHRLPAGKEEDRPANSYQDTQAGYNIVQPVEGVIVDITISLLFEINPA
jgi:hypothetical protein